MWLPKEQTKLTVLGRLILLLPLHLNHRSLNCQDGMRFFTAIWLLVWPCQCIFVVAVIVSIVHVIAKRMDKTHDIGDAEVFVAATLQSPIPHFSRWNMFFAYHLTTSLAVPISICCVNGSAILLVVVHVIVKRVHVCWTLCYILYCMIAVTSRFSWSPNYYIRWVGKPWHNRGCVPDSEEQILHGDESCWAQVPNGFIWGLASCRGARECVRNTSLYNQANRWRHSDVHL